MLGGGKPAPPSQVLTSVRLVPVVRRTVRIHEQTPRPYDFPQTLNAILS
jgi:hypothetical protein